MKFWAILILLILLGAGVFWWMRPTPEQQVLRRLEELETLADVPGSMAPLTRLGRAADLANFFASNGRIEIQGSSGGIPRLQYEGRDSIKQTIVGAFGSGLSLKVQFKDPRIVIPNPLQALMDVTVLANTGGGQPLVESIRIEWVREDGDWCIGNLTRVEALRR